MAAAMATICPQVIGKGTEIMLDEKKEKTEKVPSIRTNPVTTVATEAGFAMTNHVQAYKNPASGPYPSRTYTYSPPACGFMAPNSAYVRAPKNDRRPPTIHARYTNLADPTACIISAGTRKIPLPIMVPTTTAEA